MQIIMTCIRHSLFFLVLYTIIGVLISPPPNVHRLNPDFHILCAEKLKKSKGFSWSLPADAVAPARSIHEAVPASCRGPYLSPETVYLSRLLQHRIIAASRLQL